MATLLKGKVLVGHALKNDLKVLLLSHPRHMIRDTATHRPFMRHHHGKFRPRKLKDLAKEHLGSGKSPARYNPATVENHTLTCPLRKIMQSRYSGGGAHARRGCQSGDVALPIEAEGLGRRAQNLPGDKPDGKLNCQAGGVAPFHGSCSHAHRPAVGSRTRWLRPV